MVLLAGPQTCDSQVVGSSPGSAPLRSGLGQAMYTCVPLSPNSMICTDQGVDLSGWEGKQRRGGK